MKISSKNYTPSKMKYHYKSPAKINLFLNIIKKRKDGFHDIQSIFQLIDLYDELTFIKKNNNHINFSCNLKTLEQNNSIINTIEVFRKKFSTKKIGLDTYLKTNGFITEYSRSTASEDMAEVFSHLMYGNLPNKIDPILKKKLDFFGPNRPQVGGEKF